MQEYVINISPAGEQERRRSWFKNIRCIIIQWLQKFRLNKVTPIMFG